MLINGSRSLKFILKLAIILLGIIAFPHLNGKANAVQDQSDPNPTIQLATVATKPLKTSSYLMLDVQSRQELLAQDEEVRRAPASTVKLLTGIVAMEKLQEQDEIQVGEEVLNIEGSKIGLQPGDRILVEELLTAVYLESANDAATVLAVAAYGSLEEFIKAMNESAQKMGLTDSQFKTPHGLPSPDQYTTARDLTEIALTFIQREELMKYVRKKEGTVDWTRANGFKLSIPVKNTNQLLSIYPGDSGLKTGTTTEAGQCLVTYITRPDGDILLTLLGSKQRYVETIDLLDQGISEIRTRSALKEITSHPDSLITAPGFFTP